MSEESNHKSYVRQFGQRPRVDSELGVLPKHSELHYIWA